MTPRVMLAVAGLSIALGIIGPRPASAQGVIFVVSMFGKARPIAELDGLVYGATKMPKEDPVPYYKNEYFWMVLAIVCFLALNIYFW